MDTAEQKILVKVAKTINKENSPKQIAKEYLEKFSKETGLKISPSLLYALKKDIFMSLIVINKLKRDKALDVIRELIKLESENEKDRRKSLKEFIETIKGLQLNESGEEIDPKVLSGLSQVVDAFVNDHKEKTGEDLSDMFETDIEKIKKKYARLITRKRREIIEGTSIKNSILKNSGVLSEERTTDFPYESKEEIRDFIIKNFGIQFVKEPNIIKLAKEMLKSISQDLNELSNKKVEEGFSISSEDLKKSFYLN